MDSRRDEVVLMSEASAGHPGSPSSLVDQWLADPAPMFFGKMKTPYYTKSHSFAAPPHRRVLTTFAIVVLTFFISCGGPVGSEEIISAGGPLVGLAALLAYPLVCTIPFALVVTELCSALPEDGGFSIWVLNAFGPFWGFQEGYWSWLAQVLNSSLCLTLLLQTIESARGPLSAVASYFVKVGLAVVMTIPCCFGVRLISWTLMLLLVLTMVPFVVFCVWGLVHGPSIAAVSEYRHVNTTRSEDGTVQMEGPLSVQWSLLVNTLYWSFDGLYLTSLFGGEVRNPARSYPHAICFSFALIFFSYLMPLLVAVMLNRPNWSSWEEDSFSDVANHLGGKFLQGLVLFGTTCGTLGMYMANLFCESFQVSGMAECGLIPSFLKKRDARFETPHNAILLSFIMIIFVTALDSNELLELTNAFAALVQIMIVLAAIQLRRILPYMPRPFKVPGGTVVLVLLMLAPMAVVCYMLVTVFMKLVPALIVVVGLVIGLLYGLCSRCTVTREWLH